MNAAGLSQIRKLSDSIAAIDQGKVLELLRQEIPISYFEESDKRALIRRLLLHRRVANPAFKAEQKQALRASRLGYGRGPIPAADGFTLIEILVVVVIIGVLALAVTLSIATAGGDRQLTRESQRLQALIEHACTEAELTGREIGVRVSRNGYAFSTLGFQGWMASEQKEELRPRTWVLGMQVSLYRDGREMRLADDESESPQIVCFSSGELSPFVVRLQLGDAPNSYEVRGKADGQIEIASVVLRP